MSDIAVIGAPSFTVGFGLIGIKRQISATAQDAPAAISKAMTDKGVGILIMEGSILNAMHPEDRKRIEDSVQPVVVVLSKEAQSSSLRQSIIRAIGVDLWKED